MHLLVDHPFDMEFERTEFSDETYSVIGRALTYAQKFEGDCKALRLLLEEVSGSMRSADLFEDEESFKEFVVRLHDQTLYAQVRAISKRLQLPGDIEGILQAARSRRNAIAHEICLGIQGDIESDGGQQRVVQDIAAATRRIAEAHVVVLVGICELTDKSLPTKKYLDAYRDRVVQWVCDTVA